MKNYVILTDSCSDLDKSLREKYNIEYLKMHFSYDGKEYDADLDWEDVPFKDFYDVMRGGTRIITSQVNATQFKNAFEKYVNDGYDVLYIACSSALSASIKASLVAREEVLEKYPTAKIICIDTLHSCLGLGMLCMTASELRSSGKTIEEVASWVEENKKYVHQEATVEKLTWLKQAGRVSAASAFFGGLLNIKPIIISDVNGTNLAVEKVKGRKASYERIAQRIKERIVDCPHQKIAIVHGDCEEDALDLKQEIEKVLSLDGKIEISIYKLGPCIGASCGPGTLGVYYFGVEKAND